MRARLAAVRVPRLRRLLLALYLFTALADAAGKALVSNAAVNRALSRFVSGRHEASLRDAVTPSGNFEIFRGAARHLVNGADLYAEYPVEHSDRFKYSPTFAFLFAPLAWLPWPIALFLWSTLNALVLFAAVEALLPQRAALLTLAWLQLEVLRAMQNAQSNALVAGLIILAFVALERRSAWRAAAAVALGACVKIFPLAALTFALPRRSAIRAGAWTTSFGVVLVALPLLVTSPAALWEQYHSWRAVESSDALQRWFSVMELVQRAGEGSWPNWPVQLAGTLALVAPLFLRPDRWDHPRFRRLYLCSLLLYVVLFNHQAERASFLIAFAGIAIWYASEPSARWRTLLFACAVLTIPVMSTLVPGAVLRDPGVLLLRLTVPTLAIWLAVQRELLRPAQRAEATA